MLWSVVNYSVSDCWHRFFGTVGWNFSNTGYLCICLLAYICNFALAEFELLWNLMHKKPS